MKMVDISIKLGKYIHKNTHTHTTESKYIFVKKIWESAHQIHLGKSRISHIQRRE